MRSQPDFSYRASGLVGEGVLRQMLRDDPALDAVCSLFATRPAGDTISPAGAAGVEVCPRLRR